MKIRESLTEGPRSATLRINSPSRTFNLLVNQYSYSADLQRDSLTRGFHSLKSSPSEEGIAAFNAKFISCVSRLQLAGMRSQEVDLTNQYLFALEKTFPVWTERIRGTSRTLRATSQPSTGLDLHFLMADIMEEARNRSSSAYSATTHPQKKDKQVNPSKKTC